MRHPLLAIALTLPLTVAACDEHIDNPLDIAPPTESVIADRAIVTADYAAMRLTVVVPGVFGWIERNYVSIGSPVLRMETSADGSRTFVLTAGKEKTRTTQAVAPELIVISVVGNGMIAMRYPVPAGLGRMWVDPQGAFVALTPGNGAGTSLVTNPDALVLVKLDEPPSSTNPVVRSLPRSTSVDESIAFSPKLTTPRGAKRFLVGIGPREVLLVDLQAAFSGAPTPDAKVPLTSAGATAALKPTSVRFDDGDPASVDDARLAFALAGEGSILTATLASNETPATGESSLRAIVNLTDVGAPVSDFDFLTTAEGRRIAALTPSRRRAVLADPATSLTTPVPLARAYTSLRVLPSESGSSVLLSQLGGSTGAVAVWDVPRTADQPYRAVEALVDVASLESIVPIPGAASKFLVTSSAGSQLVVLDVASRAVTPVSVAGASRVTLSRDGARAYVVPNSGSPSFASLDLRTFTSSAFNAGLPRGSVGEVRRADGSPIVAVVHDGASLSLFDPLRPEALGTRWDDLHIDGVR